MNIISSQSIQSLLAGMLKDPSKLPKQQVTGISLDSRQAEDGYLFLSLAKDIELRERNLKQALTAKLILVLYEASQPLSDIEQQLVAQNNTLAIAVKSLADKSGEIASRFYGHPSMGLTVVAVTGTNGKTSVSQFIAQALESLDIPCGVIGTLGIGRINSLTDTGMTTPDPVSVQRTLADFYHANIKYVVIEASSHALSQGRLNSVDVDVAVYTNLTRDHLDYHKTMAEYAKAKAQLFDFETIRTAVINSDDDLGQSLIATLSNKTSLKLSRYSRLQAAKNIDFQADNISMTASGIAFELITDHGQDSIHSKIIGKFNIDNLLATIATLNALGIEHADAVKAVGNCRAVEGRMEMLGGGESATVVIDFAHTTDALTQALTSLRYHVSGKSQLLCVYGCGGNRDTGKRPLMGAAVEKYADHFVITDDNPRDEDPQQIVLDITTGIESKESIFIEHDRKLAITSMINRANKGDIVLVAGKGHEQYQEVAGIKHTFSDKQVVQDALIAANDSAASLIEVNV
ncbi:UDP-N-acetylmuramoyl-L-alanyl-D-glutamate--2,6-diaminopimelate ligase [Pseudomonadota bacterium]|nr:UDP-N-acetylmuramoyl-L-alanyl-D-glutamate--2,6-diaminopimelate ligase [Pseudomonadota bacterium]